MKWLKKIEENLTNKEINGTIIINDSKTPSGKVHVGSLRGVIIHDAILRYLRNKGYGAKFIYGIDDYDPMDGLPHNAPEDMKQHMGKPICNIPAPKGSNASDLANHYIEDFLKIFNELGVDVEIYRLRDIYRSGKFNDSIDKILKNADKVREIYLKVSNSKRADNWYPFQVVCEKCGKLGTTMVTDYSDGLVTYECKENLVSWAKGCGHKGKISPFNGNGKLPWKLEWTAKWNVFGIDIEGAGEDHCTKGGARDVADACFREIFKKQPPVNAHYGFFLINGSKMSSSKGLGFSARDMANFLPPEILRYVMINNQIKRPVEFSVDANKMIKLFNDYDKLLETTKNEILELTEISGDVTPYVGVNFQLLITLVQIPNLDIAQEVENRLGRKLTKREIESLEARISSAKFWLQNYATDEDRFELQTNTPLLMNTLTEAQKEFLLQLGNYIISGNKNEEKIKNNIYDLARKTPISAKDAFSAIYKSLLNKEYGPKVWTLLSAVPNELIINRFLTIQIDKIAFIKEVEVNDIENIIKNIKSIKSILGKVYIKNPTNNTDDYNEYFFIKKIHFINNNNREEICYFTVSDAKGYNISLEKESDLSEEYWFTSVFPKIKDKIGNG